MLALTSHSAFCSCFALTCLSTFSFVHFWSNENNAFCVGCVSLSLCVGLKLWIWCSSSWFYHCSNELQLVIRPVWECGGGQEKKKWTQNLQFKLKRAKRGLWFLWHHKSNCNFFHNVHTKVLVNRLNIPLFAGPKLYEAVKTYNESKLNHRFFNGNTSDTFNGPQIDSTHVWEKRGEESWIM